MRRNKALVMAILFAAAAAVYAAEKKKPIWFQNIGNVSTDSNDSPSVAGVRGLNEGDDIKIVGSESRDYVAMEELDAITFTEEELNQFAAEGNLK